MEKIEVRFAKGVRAGVTAAWIRHAVLAALKAERRSGWSVGVLVTNDAEIRRINKRHLRHDYATDVISFPLEAPPLPPLQSFLGDVVVSADTARRSAEELGLPYREELARYLVHGTLHLLGYDDKKPRDKKKMFARQESILEAALRKRGKA